MPAFCAAVTSQATGVNGVGRKGCSSGCAMKFVRLDGGVGLRLPFLFGEGLGRTGLPMPLISSARALLGGLGLTLRPGLARLPGLALGRRGCEGPRPLLPVRERDLDVTPGR